MTEQQVRDEFPTAQAEIILALLEKAGMLEKAPPAAEEKPE